ncbi:MAG TPA: hypothetical protein VF591_13020 [Pyrinomonadaceae bacterium]|jgi:hypothetical protein
MSKALLVRSQTQGEEGLSPTSSEERPARYADSLERLCREACEVRLLCLEQERRFALQRERILVMRRTVEEARLALAMQWSEMTELNAQLEETRYRLYRLSNLKIS